MSRTRTSVSKSFPLPSPLLKVEEDSSSMVKQGIGTILGSDKINKKVSSFRRTISADMSSRKWLAQNGLILSSSSTTTIDNDDDVRHLDDDDEKLKNFPGQDEIWRKIQSSKDHQKMNNDDDGHHNQLKKPSKSLNVWSSILVEKSKNGGDDDDDSSRNDLPPYVHPLVKRSTSTLSEKSLEICTESLGSETGSDHSLPPASYPASETGEPEENKEEETAQKQEQRGQQVGGEGRVSSFEDIRVAKYNYSSSKRMTTKSFPPPLASLARGDGPSLHMHSHRKNGRLVLEAVSVNQTSYFHAERQEGRLLLSLVNSPTSQEEVEDRDGEYEEVFDNFEDVGIADEEYEGDKEEVEIEEEDEDIEKGMGIQEMTFVMEQSKSLPSGGGINVHRPTLMMKRFYRVDNKDPTWSNKLNKAVNLMEVENLTQIPQSLPPVAPRVAQLIPSQPPRPSPAASGASINAYEYFWKKKPTVASILSPISQQCTPLKDNNNNNNKLMLAKTYNNNNNNNNNNNTSLKAYDDKQNHLVLMRGNKGDYLVPLCKDSRKSLLIWQPHCIAT